MIVTQCASSRWETSKKMLLKRIDYSSKNIKNIEFAFSKDFLRDFFLQIVEIWVCTKTPVRTNDKLKVSTIKFQARKDQQVVTYKIDLIRKLSKGPLFKIMSILWILTTRKFNFNYEQPRPNEEPFFRWESDNIYPASDEGASSLGRSVSGWLVIKGSFDFPHFHVC